MNDRHRRIIRAWKRIEHHRAEVSWREKSWIVNSGGIPELINLPVDLEGKPRPRFETALEAAEHDARRNR